MIYGMYLYVYRKLLLYYIEDTGICLCVDEYL